MPKSEMSVSACPRRPMRILFVTLGHVESDFYGRVGQRLRDVGHEVAQVTFSRRAARRLIRMRQTAWCLPDRMLELGDRIDIQAEVQRIQTEYEVPTFPD